MTAEAKYPNMKVAFNTGISDPPSFLQIVITGNEKAKIDVQQHSLNGHTEHYRVKELIFNSPTEARDFIRAFELSLPELKAAFEME